jgi:hypothetical protein
MADFDMVEQAGCDQGLERRIERCGVEASVGRRMEIGAHRVGIDAVIALYSDGLRRLVRIAGRRNQHERRDHQRGCDRHPAAAPGRYHGFTHHVPPVPSLTGRHRIARAGRNNVGAKVSCGPIINVATISTWC